MSDVISKNEVLCPRLFLYHDYRLNVIWIKLPRYFVYICFLWYPYMKVWNFFSPCVLSENDRPTSLVPDLIDYNMPLTATYLKQMKLQCRTSTERVSSLCGQGQINCRLTAYLIKASQQMRSALHCHWISIDSRSDYLLFGLLVAAGRNANF